jgi:glycosyltransferase involved in cell wall biosynthesis
VKLTAVLPNYNHAEYLPHALNALLAQTRPADELIVIDDASTDNSVAIIEDYLARYPNIRFVRNADNLGIASNMNRGLEMATGDVVYFAAADDIAYPSLFETGMALLESHPAAALFSARCEIIDRRGEVTESLPTPTPLSDAGFIGPERALTELLRDDGWFVGGTTLYQRAMLIAAGGFSSELGSFCDGYVSRLLALKHGACYVPAVLCGWRRMEGGFAWSQAINLKSMMDVIRIAEEKMRDTNGIFPPSYIHRWKARHVFGARRFALIQARRRAVSEGGVIRPLLAICKEALATAWLLCTLRPWDLLTVARRRWHAHRLRCV